MSCLEVLSDIVVGRQDPNSTFLVFFRFKYPSILPVHYTRECICDNFSSDVKILPFTT